MASSTRRKAIELWHSDIPSGDKERLAKTLFSYDNPPGTEVISGSQDALGIEYWPRTIDSVFEESILRFLEDHLFLVTLGPRTSAFSVLEGTRIDTSGAERLAEAADECWKAIISKNLAAFGAAFTESFDAQAAMFPNMVDEGIRNIIERYRTRAQGWKLSGAGGGGYLILVSDKEIANTIRIKIRRSVSIDG
jgi:hypothetical protein